MAFRIIRTETIMYAVDVDRAEVEAQLSYCEPVGLDDRELRSELEDGLRSVDAVHDWAVERSERYGDVQGSTFSVRLWG
ncbi:hypothetical protein BB737_07765 [Mycobacterium avium subsp. hominissuis]|uniref:hypothetical protein n=1 Tax=Mycobacterium avium TaxID=1764 RepID=UPI000BB2D32F|nr:hypothetical protein [Mycobacterium avium]PBJ66410.1 hypothetical protein BB737_07765 [Mycobacterium avium subsp. hominissuis]